MKTVRLEGIVLSGKGEGAKFLRLPWVKKQIREKLGFLPYAGTLNLRITEESVKLKNSLTKSQDLDILPAKGFCCGKCFKASFNTELNCAIVIPQIAGYPEDLIEIIGPENLRKKFHLSDGYPIQIDVTF